jgi:hypothetical protein
VYAAAEEQVLQHHGVVMRLIMGREHECDPAVLRQRAQPIEFVRMLPNLRLVAAPEFLPTRGIMPEPLAQTYPLKDAAQAHRDLESRKTVGSTVLTV